MTNNDILRRIRYILNFNDQKMLEVFNLAGSDVSLDQVSSWLKPKIDTDEQGDDDLDQESGPSDCEDVHLATFLNGLIIEKRGKKEGSEVINETKVNNNIIFNKLKIAFNLKAEEILEILKLVEFTFSKHELSALFRKPDHKHYRECKDQVLRNFLGGIQIRFKTNPS
jgi:uncharacterized protein YehS (DUF1456 family)